MILNLCEDGIENLSLVITICHHSASLVMSIGDPQEIPQTLKHTYSMRGSRRGRESGPPPPWKITKI